MDVVHLCWIRPDTIFTVDIAEDIDLALILHFSELKTRPCRLAASISALRFRSCSSSVAPNTHMSSAMLAQPLRSCRISSIRCWKMSWLILRPNGRRVKQYRPTGVLNVVRSWHSSAIGSLQYPAFASSLLKIFTPWNWCLFSLELGFYVSIF